MTDLIGQFQRKVKFFYGILFIGLGPDLQVSIQFMDLITRSVPTEIYSLALVVCTQKQPFKVTFISIFIIAQKGAFISHAALILYDFPLWIRSRLLTRQSQALFAIEHTLNQGTMPVFI